MASARAPAPGALAAWQWTRRHRRRRVGREKRLARQAQHFRPAKGRIAIDFGGVWPHRRDEIRIGRRGARAADSLIRFEEDAGRNLLTCLPIGRTVADRNYPPRRGATPLDPISSPAMRHTLAEVDRDPALCAEVLTCRASRFSPTTRRRRCRRRSHASRESARADSPRIVAGSGWGYVALADPGPTRSTAFDRPAGLAQHRLVYLAAADPERGRHWPRRSSTPGPT